VNIGELFLVELPARGGPARPAIVAQTPLNLPTVLVIPLTSQIDSLRFPGTVLIEATPENGLQHNSIALVFQLTVVDRRFLTERLGQVSKEAVQQIWKALDSLTGR
jgi:mRNA interferase MazF